MSITVSGDAHFSPHAAAEDIKRHFETRGFVVIEGALPEDLLTEVKAEIRKILMTEGDRHLETVSIDRKDRFDTPIESLFDLNPEYVRELYDTLQHISGLYKIIACESVLRLTSILGLQAPNVRARMLKIGSPSGFEYFEQLNIRTGLMQPHQDTRNMRTDQSLNFWIPLTDVYERSGAMKVYPESHENGLRSPKNSEENEQGYERIQEEVVAEYEGVLCTVSAGDAVAFHPYLFHRGTPNQSNSTRWTANIHFDDATDIPWMIDGENPYRPDE